MRRGFPGLTLLVQETLKTDPYSGHLFVFRSRAQLTSKEKETALSFL